MDEGLTDQVTKWIRVALRFLMIEYPARTSMGIMGGIVAWMIRDFVQQFVAVSLDAFGPIRLILAGVFLSNIRLLFKRDILPESIEKKFAAIRAAAAQGKLSPAQQKMLCLQVVQQTLEEVKTVDQSGDLPNGTVPTLQRRARKSGPA